MNFGAETLVQFHMHIYSTKSQYHPNAFHYFSLLYLGSLCSSEMDLMTTPFEKRGDDVTVGRHSNYSVSNNQNSCQPGDKTEKKPVPRKWS